MNLRSVNFPAKYCLDFPSFLRLLQKSLPGTYLSSYLITEYNEFFPILFVHLFGLESDKVFYERWWIRGTQVKDLTTNPAFQKSANESGYISQLKEENRGSYYGARYRTYLLAKETGYYTFYTFCDDSCQLFISSCISPSDKAMIINQSWHVEDAPQNCCK